MLQSAIKACDTAVKSGVSPIEVFQTEYRETKINIKKDEFLPECTRVKGRAIRVIRKKKVGFSYSTDMNGLELQLKSAISSAEAIDTRYDWNIDFPPPQKYRATEHVYDDRIEKLDLKEAVEYCRDVASILVDENLIPLDGFFSAKTARFAIANSNCLQVCEKRTTMTYEMKAAFGSRGHEVATTASRTVRNLELDPRVLSEKLITKAKALLVETACDFKVNQVILSPIAFYSVLRPIILAFDVTRVKKGVSPYREVGATVACPYLTIYDDGLAENGLMSSKCDDEGVASKRNPLIKNGVLQGFLYDYFHAMYDGIVSTGNAVRKSVAAPPKISPRNLVVEPSACDVVKDTPNGIYIEEFENDFGADPVSGGFIFNAKEAFAVRSGEIGGAVRSAILKGNSFDALKKITGVGKDVQVFKELVSPSIKIEGLDVFVS